MKISEEDLKNIFKSNKPSLNRARVVADGQPVKMFKTGKKFSEIKSLRKKILKIHSADNKKSGFKKDRFVIFFLRTLFFWGIIGFFIIGLFNYPAYYDRIKWSYYVDYLNQRLPAVPDQLPKIKDEALKLPGKIPTIEGVNNNRLTISKISVDAPVIWDIDQNNILTRLTDGVVHYMGTSHPGEGGNVFIVGHSSNYFWIASDYSSIFSLLDKLEKGDRIEITRNNKKYFYDVKDKRIVNPDEVSYLQNTPAETLTLMTCWPVGTSIDRLIIQAELVYTSY